MHALERHNSAVLEFSGGKDSLACLLLTRAWWDKITVVWLNTGACLPETVEQMAEIRAMVPHFLEVETDQAAQIARCGYPVDVLPVRNFPAVGHLSGFERLRLQPFLDCCYHNLMAPMHRAALSLGATLIIRGQKRGDTHRGPLRSGDVVDGVEYLFPVEGWTDVEVLDYVRDSGLLPRHYAVGNTSMDCWNCTAYLAENHWKLAYLAQHYPDKARELRTRLKLIERETEQDLRHLRAVLEG